VIVHPAAIALLAGSLLGAALLLHAAWHGAAVLRGWDLSSGSALQLSLERRTQLVSTLVALALAYEVAALLLFVLAADALAPLFTGAMCAAGTLAANPWGYPTLLLRLLNAVLAGLWLVVNHADGLGHDYPLIRTRYALLLAFTPLVLLEGALQARYLHALEPEVITSCCGRLFSRSGGGIGAVLSELPAEPTAVGFYAALAAATVAAVIHVRAGGPRSAVALAIASGLALVAGLAGIVSFVSPYVYELPAHRCPFCLLRAEYRWIGYPLYAPLLGGVVCGVGAGLLAPARRHASLGVRLPPFQRRLARGAALLFAAVGILSAWLVMGSALRA